MTTQQVCTLLESLTEDGEVYGAIFALHASQQITEQVALEVADNLGIDYKNWDKMPAKKSY